MTPCSRERIADQTRLVASRECAFLWALSPSSRRHCPGDSRPTSKHSMADGKTRSGIGSHSKHWKTCNASPHASLWPTTIDTPFASKTRRHADRFPNAGTWTCNVRWPVRSYSSAAPMPAATCRCWVTGSTSVISGAIDWFVPKFNSTLTRSNSFGFVEVNQPTTYCLRHIGTNRRASRSATDLRILTLTQRPVKKTDLRMLTLSRQALPRLTSEY
jgi:hypothetical protein